MSLRTSADKIETLRRIGAILKNISDNERQAFLSNTEKDEEVDDEGYKIPELVRPLTWAQIREMVASGLIEIGSHSVNHPIMSRCRREVQEREIRESRRRIENEINQPCTMFAYPNGRPQDYTSETISILKREGLKIAVTTVEGRVDLRTNPIYELHRYGARAAQRDFRMVLLGITELASRFK